MKPTAHDIEAEGLPSASGFDSEFRCLGKRALCARLPKEEGSYAAESGHRIHEALKESSLEGLTMTEERTASRIMYGESELVHEYGFEGADIAFENRIWDVDDALNHTWSARIDRYDWLAHEERLLVIDDKSGWTLPPPIKDNWQVRSEAALLTEYLDARETVVALIHPHHADSLWEAKVYTRDQMLAILDTVRHNVRQIQLPDQPRTAGGIQCQWCPAKRVCPEYQAWSASLTLAVADEIKDAGYTAINRRSVEERGEHVRALKEQLKNIEFILGQYVELATRDANAVRGYVLRRRLIRDVTNEAQAIELTRNALGQDIVYAALTFSIAQLEEELAKKRGSKRQAKEEIEQLLRPVLRYRHSKYYLEESRSL
jgi:hypothetical protein